MGEWDARETSRQRQSKRASVLHALRQAETPLTITDIAQRLSIHPNTVRFHLDVLVSDHQVVQVSNTRQQPGRPAVLFQAASGMDPTGPRNYRLLAAILAGGLAELPEASERAEAAGVAWGQQIATEQDDGEAIDRLVTLLHDLGFDPQYSDPDLISLRHCPFLDLVDQQGPVICAIHRGLMRGALNQWDADIAIERLEPFTRPDRCTAFLARQ